MTETDDAKHVEEVLPAKFAHFLLLLVSVLPLFIPVDTNFNVIATATLTVYIGCRRSVKPTPPADSMSQKDAMRFPLIGSLVLFSLFMLFKFLPKDLVNAVLTAYFVVLGTAALTATFAPLIEVLLPEQWRQKVYEYKGLKIPVIMKEPADFEITAAEVVAGAASVAFCSWYYAKKHWLANNALGLAFSVQGIEHLSLGAVSTGVILLTGLFFYDIFWVFFTPVMVSVAKSFDAPIKLLFLRAGDTGKMPFSMLGLGDIVIPGIFVALLLRYDVAHGHTSRYFYSAFGGYILGLTTTIVVMNVFQAAQPALLYLVPAILGAVALHSAINGDFKKVFSFSEEPDEKPEAHEADEGRNGTAAVADGQPVEAKKGR